MIDQKLNFQLILSVLHTVLIVTYGNANKITSKNLQFKDVFVQDRTLQEKLSASKQNSK